MDIFVAGVGTGGTVSGVGKYLKEKNPNIKVVAVEPAASPVLSKGTAGGYKIQGFIPDTLDTKIYDEVVDIENEETFEFARLFATNKGFLAGISFGAVLAESVKLALRKENEKKSIVMILPDTGERYLSIDLFKE